MLLMREWMASQFWMVHYGHCYAYSLWATAAECTPAETRVIMSNQWSFQLPSVLLLQGAQLEYVLFSLRLLLPLSWSTSPSTFPNHRLFPSPTCSSKHRAHLSQEAPSWVMLPSLTCGARQKSNSREGKGTWVSLPLCKETFTSPNCGLQLWWHQNDFNMGPIYGSLNSVFLNWFFCIIVWKKHNFL